MKSSNRIACTSKDRMPITAIASSPQATKRFLLPRSHPSLLRAAPKSLRLRQGVPFVPSL